MNKILMSALGVSTLAIAGLAVSTSAQALSFVTTTCNSGGIFLDPSNPSIAADCAGRAESPQNDADGDGQPLLDALNNGITPSLNTGTQLVKFNQFLNNWSFLGKSDESDFGPFTSNPSGNTGTLSFDTALNGIYAISLKAGNSFNVYLLKDLSLAAGDSLAFDTGVQQGLSHASLYKYSQPVPEPLTILGTGLALGLGGLFKSKQKQKSEA